MAGYGGEDGIMDSAGNQRQTKIGDFTTAVA